MSTASDMIATVLIGNGSVMPDSINPMHEPPHAHGIALSPADVRQLEAALDAPPAVIESLRKLLDTPPSI